MKVRMDEVKPGDIIRDLGVRVEFSEPHSDYTWALECVTLGKIDDRTMIRLPNEHKVSVERA